MPEYLTPEEMDACRLIGQVDELLRTAIIQGPTAQTDYEEVAHHLHVVFRYVASQGAARAYPHLFRPLGGAVPSRPAELVAPAPGLGDAFRAVADAGTFGTPDEPRP